MNGIIYWLMLLMLIPFHVLRNIGLILNMIVLINVCFVNRIHRLCLFPVNLILILILNEHVVQTIAIKYKTIYPLQSLKRGVG